MSKTKVQLAKEVRMLRVLLTQATEKQRISNECYAELEHEKNELRSEATRLHESNQTLQHNLLALMEEKKPWYKRIFL